MELEEEGLCLPCFGNLKKFRLASHEERIRVSLTYGNEGWAFFRYEEGVKEVLHKIKFEGRRNLIRLLTREAGSFLETWPRLRNYDYVVPIPLDSARRLEREFNQSGLIAGQIGKATGLELRERTLSKRYPTPPQSLLGREGRKLNLNGAFQVNSPRQVRGKSVLLVDDIFTTGSTFEEAAKALKAAGADRVGYLALARAFGN